MSGKNDNAEQAQNCGASFDHLTSPFITNVDNRVLFQDRFVGAGMWFRRLTASAPTISAFVELIRGKSTPAAVTGLRKLQCAWNRVTEQEQAAIREWVSKIATHF